MRLVKLPFVLYLLADSFVYLFYFCAVEYRLLLVCMLAPLGGYICVCILLVYCPG